MDIDDHKGKIGARREKARYIPEIIEDYKIRLFLLDLV
jgi:hypothetical protein